MDNLQVTDILVETNNPQYLDETLQNMGGRAVIVGAPNYITVDGYHVMRVFGDSGFVKFACESQGYCKIIRELDSLV